MAQRWLSGVVLTMAMVLMSSGTAGAQGGPAATYFGSTRLSDGSKFYDARDLQQRGTLFNSQTTGAANTAVVVTIAAVANEQARASTVDARCSAGTSNITITDGGTTIFSTPTAEVTTTRLRIQWPKPLTGAVNSAVVITLATCGVGNTGTLTVQADRG